MNIKERKTQKRKKEKHRKERKKKLYFFNEWFRQQNCRLDVHFFIISFPERKAAEAEKLQQKGSEKIEKELSKLMINSKTDSATIKRKLVIATYQMRTTIFSTFTYLDQCLLIF